MTWDRGSPPVQIIVGIVSMIIGGTLASLSNYTAGYLLVTLGVIVTAIGFYRISKVSD